MENKNLALEAIRKKLLGKELTYKEIYAIMDQIAEDRLGDVLTTYFVASGYSKGFTNDEIYYLTKAMVETGEYLEFKGIIADKHSIGGTPGTRATMIVVPIIAACGYTIPKSSSRAITTPAGTADCMETIAGVKFSKNELYKIIEKANGCIVWGGAFKIAPADDEIIRIEEPLLFESFDKVLVSIMAKKIAFGSTHVVLDIPYGKTVKVHNEDDAKILGNKFKFLARKFNIHLEPFIHRVHEPAGGGVGPLLEARDAMMVLEQHPERPMGLEKRAVQLCEMLLEMCLKDDTAERKKMVQEQYGGSVKKWVEDILQSKKALEKMKEIIEAQKGDGGITSDKMKPAKYAWDLKSDKTGEITEVNNMNITLLAKLLGAPEDRKAGMYVYKRKGEEVKKGEIIATFYGESKYRITETIDSVDMFPIMKVS